MKTDFKKVTGIGKEVKTTIQENIQDLIHPWQYKDSEIHIINIDSDITDVETNWNQEIRFRYGFQINEDKSLNIPTMFVQMNGIYSKKSEYRALIEKMVTDTTIRFKDTNHLFDRYHSIEAEEARELCEQNKVDAFKNVNTSMRKMMTQKLLEFIEKYEHQIHTSVFQRVLGNIVYMEEPQIISLLQNFDYCFKNPKIIVENMDDDNFTDITKYVLIYLYTLGFDILIFSPKGSSFLRNYELNTITLEKYLPPTEEKYDYRDEEEIRKAEKEEKKQEKKKEKERTKWERKRRRNGILLGLLIGGVIIGFVAFMGYLIWEEESTKSDFKKQTEKISWDMEAVTMYVNSDEVPAYAYASEESTQSSTFDKDDEVSVTGISSEWIRIKVSSGSAYIKKENVREDMYDIDVDNFIMNIKVAESVNAYTFPNTESEILHTFNAEDTMKATGYTSDWYQIDYHGDTGFVNRKELTVYEEPEDEQVEDTKEVEDTNSESEEMTDGEITEDSTDVGIGLILIGILIFLGLCLIFTLIMC